ncbi:MAG TPA: PHP domain-containing protein [Chloroflexota bacterium]|nr:PHP domain-containing protein [Chloroflexota bacterium]
MNRVDLHTHTTASDGTFTPAELVVEAQRVRLDVLAICDHDSTEGIAPALAANSNGALQVIAGVEVNTDVPGGEVHVLGYFKQAPQGAMQALLARLREGRYQRARGMADKLAALGTPIAFERVVEIAGGGSIGRPHVARAIVEAGHAATVGEAFERFIGRHGPAYVERLKLSPAEAARAIRDSGGVPVLAHPFTFDLNGTLLKSVHPEQLVPELVKAGLGGIETYYYRYPGDAIVSLLRLAEKFGLIATGGSDFHGSIKPGQGLGSVFVPWDSVERLNRALDMEG